MTDGIHFFEAIQMWTELICWYVTYLRQKSLQFSEDQLIGGSVQLNAVAGGDKHKFNKGHGNMSACEACQCNADDIFIKR